MSEPLSLSGVISLSITIVVVGALMKAAAASFEDDIGLIYRVLHAFFEIVGTVLMATPVAIAIIKGLAALVRATW